VGGRGGGGPRAAHTAPAIEPFLGAADPWVRAQAAGAIAHVSGDHGPLHALTAELLANPTRGPLTQALDALVDFPAERLEPLLEHPDEWVRLPAVEALWRITRDPRRVAGTLHALLAPTPAGYEALVLLAELPPEASAPVRDRLAEWRDSDRRVLQSGIADELVERDEHLRELAARLLA
jgi:hypothetical protein